MFSVRIHSENLCSAFQRELLAYRHICYDYCLLESDAWRSCPNPNPAIRRPKSSPSPFHPRMLCPHPRRFFSIPTPSPHDNALLRIGIGCSLANTILIHRLPHYSTSLQNLLLSNIGLHVLPVHDKI